MFKELRESKNYSQEALAKCLNVKQASVSMWEVGKTRPTFEKIGQIAVLFGVSEQEIINCFKKDK